MRTSLRIVSLPALTLAVVLAPTARAKRLILTTDSCEGVCQYRLCFHGRGVRRPDIVLCSDSEEADVTLPIPTRIVPQGRSLIPRRLGPAFDFLGAHVLLRCLGPSDCNSVAAETRQ